MKTIRRLVKASVGIATIGGSLYFYNNHIKGKSEQQLRNEAIQILGINLPNIVLSKIATVKVEKEQQNKTENKEIPKQNKKQELISLNEQKQQIQYSQQQNNVQKSQEKQESVLSKNQNQNKSKEQQQATSQQSQVSSSKSSSMDLNQIRRLSELPQLPKILQKQPKYMIIVSDIGFTEQFQQKLLQTIRKAKKLPNNQEIQVYRANILNEDVRNALTKDYNVKLKDETIFLIKNQLDPNFIAIEFDMYMQYPSVINSYLTKINPYDLNNQTEYLKKIEKMSPNQSFLIYIYDDTQPSQKRAQRLLASKYIQMELALHHLDTGIKVIPVQASVVRENNIIPPQKIRPNSLHIIRKHNEFTHTTPNLYFKFNGELKPYHLLSDIGFHNKKGQVAIQSYLNKIQTFNSLSVITPFILSVTIDKNRITTQNYRTIMQTFKEIKRNNKYPQVGIALKFSEVGYLGKDQPQNSEFVIKLANLAELQSQSYMHQIQKAQQIQSLGITQENWLKSSYEYLYPHQAISQNLINDFIGKVIDNKIPQYYRSDKPSSIQNVHKIVATNFDKEILQNNLDHFVFEYSEHCPSCKMISPLIGYMNQILQPVPLEARFDIHRMDCHKNRVKSQIYSPYTPNMNYFKNEWKNLGPVKINLQTLSHRGLNGLYDFCVITKILKTIDSQKFNETIQNAKGWDKSQFF